MGKSVGIQLAQKGANIIVVARDKVKLARAVEEFEVCTTSGAFVPSFTPSAENGS